jgi:hypothetical protein
MKGINVERSFNLDQYDLGTLITDPQQREEIKSLVCDFAGKIELPTQKDVEVLIEQYSILKARKIDAYTWISTIIGEVSKKDSSKQYIGYIIGIIRNRMTFGWGASRSDEEILILNTVEKLMGREISLDSKAEIYKLMGEYGATKIAFELNKLDFESLFLKAIEQGLKDQENYIKGL